MRMSGSIKQIMSGGETDPRTITGAIWKAGRINSMSVDGEPADVLVTPEVFLATFEQLKKDVAGAGVEIGLETSDAQHPGEGTVASVGVIEQVKHDDEYIYITRGTLFEAEAKLIEMNARGLLAKRGFSIVSSMLGEYDEKQKAYVPTDIRIERVDIVSHPAIEESRIMTTKEIETKDLQGSHAEAGVVPQNPTGYKNSEKPWKAPTLQDLTNETWDKLDDAGKRKIASLFAWAKEMPPKTFGDLKLPHHDPNGDANRQGVIAAYAAVMGARGGVDIPAADKDKVIAHLTAHRKELGLATTEDEEMDKKKSSDEEQKKDTGKKESEGDADKMTAPEPQNAQASTAMAAVMAENKVLRAAVEELKTAVTTMKAEAAKAEKLAGITKLVDETVASGKATAAMREHLIEAGMAMDQQKFRDMMKSMPEAWKHEEKASTPEKNDADLDAEYEMHKAELEKMGITKKMFKSSHGNEYSMI